jgi:ribosomal-protein-alanine N-acetyltransferase
MKINPSKNIELHSGRLTLKVLDSSYAGMILDYYSRNRDFFSDFMSDLTEKFYTYDYQVSRAWKEFELMQQQRHMRLYIFEKTDIGFTHIIGDITISDILWGSLQTCSIGYKIDKKHLRRGFATESVKRAVDYIFNDLNLERIVAHIKPENIPSIRMIEKIGFKEEGISRQYIRLAGQRKDHLRYALIKGDIINE